MDDCPGRIADTTVSVGSAVRGFEVRVSEVAMCLCLFRLGDDGVGDVRHVTELLVLLRRLVPCTAERASERVSE